MAQQEINYWLMKSEPVVYGIEDLKEEGDTLWDGIRNYQARNFMRSMKIKDLAFFYHSNCKPPGIVGLMEVIEIGLLDPTQFDIKSNYFDKKSTKEKPRWDCSRLRYIGRFSSMVSLDDLRSNFSEDQLTVTRKGNRLSILPVPQNSAKIILKLGGKLSE